MPWCTPPNPWQFDLWSEPRGVYVVSGNNVDLVSRTNPGGLALSFNDGTGWARAPSQPHSLGAITGFPGGRPLVFEGQGCGISFFDETQEICAAALGNARVFVASAQRAFAIAGDRLLINNGSYFTQYGRALPKNDGEGAYQLWANADVAVVAAGAGKVYVFSDAQVEPLVLDIPGGGDAWSLWGFGRDDLWVGSTDGRLAHYDGAEWTVHQPTSASCGPIHQLWGTQGTLFFASHRVLGRFDARGFAIIASGSCDPVPDLTAGLFEQVAFRKLWGNSPTELFIVVSEEKYVVEQTNDGFLSAVVTPDGCDPVRVYWYNGQSLGRL